MVLEFGDGTTPHELPFQCSINVCQMPPFLCRPTPQQSDDETQVTATMSLTALPLAEFTIVHLPVVGVEGLGVFLEGREVAAAKLEKTSRALVNQSPILAKTDGLVKYCVALGNVRIRPGDQLPDSASMGEVAVSDPAFDLEIRPR